jgi:hypothetical protein
MKIRGNNNKARVQQRKEEAVQRQVVRDKRTHEQQLELIKERSGESKKEKYRLVKLIKDVYNKNKNKK